MPAQRSIGELIDLVTENPQSCFYVVVDNRRLEGVIIPDVRARFGAHILLLRRPSPSGSENELEVIPEPDTVVKRGDRLVPVAQAAALARLRGL